MRQISYRILNADGKTKYIGGISAKTIDLAIKAVRRLKKQYPGIQIKSAS